MVNEIMAHSIILQAFIAEEWEDNMKNYQGRSSDSLYRKLLRKLCHCSARQLEEEAQSIARDVL